MRLHSSQLPRRQAHSQPLSRRSGCSKRWKRCILSWSASTYSWTTRAINAKLVKEWLSRPGRRIKLHFLPAFCPHLKSDRTTLGGDAQEHHAQQMLPNPRRIRRSDPGFPARRGPQEVGRTLRFGHRQFSYNFTQGFSAYGVNRVYRTPEPTRLHGLGGLRATSCHFNISRKNKIVTSRRHINETEPS